MPIPNLPRYAPISKIIDPIEIDYKSNNLSFEFLAFNFRDATKNQYAYKMEAMMKIGYSQDPEDLHHILI